ncbi:DUF2953 domain-containing protein [Ruminiclostridium josui]|uniref:DUF2953 domain-containing protein n=1 Tax=Ruminiclostridium josui TaxID=1499 RepID=UPI000A9F5A18|nr:DUF2953 domain-containing protein [Ruminiclostridium josui]
MVALIIALKIILYMFLIIAALVLLVIFVPFKYYAEGSKYETISVKGNAYWLFGAVKINFNYSTQDGFGTKFSWFGFKHGFKKKNEDKSVKEAQEITKKKVKKSKEKPAYSYIKYEVLVQCLKSVFKILNHFKPSKFRIDAKVGFEDPMYTGLLCAIKNVALQFLIKTAFVFRQILKAKC